MVALDIRAGTGAYPYNQISQSLCSFEMTDYANKGYTGWIIYHAGGCLLTCNASQAPDFCLLNSDHCLMTDTKQELYQKEFDLLKGRDRHPYLQHLLPYVEKGDPVLDLGCGLLVNSLYLRDNGFNAVGMDISHEMLRESKSINFPLICADGLKLPFKQNSFGGLLLIDFIEHLPRGKVDEFLTEAKRVLKNDAVVFLHVPLEKSLSYRLLNKLKAIWPKNPNHQHDYTLKEITDLIKGKSCRVLWERRENGFVYSLRNHLKEIKLLVVLSTFLGRYLKNIFTAAYTACLSFEIESNSSISRD